MQGTPVSRAEIEARVTRNQTRADLVLLDLGELFGQDRLLLLLLLLCALFASLWLAARCEAGAAAEAAAAETAVVGLQGRIANNTVSRKLWTQSKPRQTTHLFSLPTWLLLRPLPRLESAATLAGRHRLAARLLAAEPVFTAQRLLLSLSKEGTI